MTTLPLALVGPLAAYGNGTHERYRSTALLPTKSAVCGLIGACLGRDYQDDQSDLHELKIHIRADQPGSVITDFQTVSHTHRADGTRNPDIFPVQRQLLQDSAFLVVIEGESKLLGEIEAALRNPVYLPYLGLRACVPSRPVYVEGLSEEDPVTLMKRLPWLSQNDQPKRGYLEELEGVLTWNDQPLNGRRFTRRNVQPITFN